MQKFLNYLVLALMPIGIFALVKLVLWLSEVLYLAINWMRIHEMNWHLSLFCFVACVGVYATAKLVYKGCAEYVKFVKGFIQTRNASKG